MLTRHQLIALFDYCKYFRFMAEKLTQEAENSQSLYPELRKAIVKEQMRRARELTHLEKALGAEIGDYTEGSDIECHEPTASPEGHATGPRAKRKSNATGKKSKRRAGGTAGTSSSARSAKRKPRTETK